MLLLTQSFIPLGTQVSRGTDSFIPSGTQTTKGTDLKNPTTLGVTKWHKSLTEVFLTAPMTRNLVRNRSLNSFTEASSIQSQKLCVRGELSLTWTKYKAPFDRVLFLIYNGTTKNSNVTHAGTISSSSQSSCSRRDCKA